MEIKVSARHMDVPESVRAHVREKAEKLDRYYDRLMSVDVIMDVQGDRQIVEMIARADHHVQFVAKHEDSDLYATIDHVAKEMESQLRKHKEKLRKRKHPN